MCNLSEGFYDRGVEAGREEGQTETAKRMIKDGKLSMAVIAQYSGLTLEEVQRLAAGK